MPTPAQATDSPVVDKRRLLVVIAGVVFAFDRLTKLAIAGSIPLWHRTPVLGDVVWLTHVNNPGAALGIWSGDRLLVLGLTLTSLMLLALLYRFLPRHSVLRLVAVAVAIGGALGNLFDRLVSARGVLDFIEVHAGGIVLPVFNLADLAVVLGAFALAGSIWWDERALA